MSYVKQLRCTHCGKVYDYDENPLMCETPGCLGRLDVEFDYEAIKNVLSRDIIASRNPRDPRRYIELLPLDPYKPVVSIGEGNTPLIKAKRLGEKLGLKNLYLKDEGRNTTFSFKDRPIGVGANKGYQIGMKTLVTASSGNAAASLAAYAAKLGVECYAFVLDIAPEAKIAQLKLYGAKVFKVRGLEKGEDPTVKMLHMVVKKFGWYPCPSFGPFNPYQTEGTKPMAYEVCEQLEWEPPDIVFLQVGGGGLLYGNWKGYKEFETLGITNKTPRIVAVQSTGNMPLVRAYKEDMNPKKIKPWSKPSTIASGIEDPYPWDGASVLKAIKQSNGTAIAVTDDEIIDAILMLGKFEGIFTSPTGAAALAGLIKMVNEGEIDRDEKIVIPITESGLKNPMAAASRPEISSKTPVINPDLDEFIKTAGFE